MNKEVKEFLKSDEKYKIFKYKNKNLNATVDFFEWNNVFAIFRYLIFLFLRVFPLPFITPLIYKMFGVKIGKNTFIGINVIIDPFYPKLISIGNDCVLGWGTKILAHEGYLRHYRLGRVKIGNNVLIGSFATIRSGVIIEDDVIIAMDALVDRDIKAHEVVGGIPEHEIKKLKSLL